MVQNGTCVPACTVGYTCYDQQIQYTDVSCNVTPVAVCVAPQFCSAGSAVCINNTPEFIAANGFTGHLEVRPKLVPTGSTARLYWDVTGVQSCTVTGNGDSWSTMASGATGVETSPITQKTTYTLTCQTGATPLIENLDIVLVPVFREI